MRHVVPCNGCTACCKKDLIFLRPELGDRIEEYQTETQIHPITRLPALTLKHKENGDCIYLGKDGCTIWERAPAVCQEFDCRVIYLSTTRSQRKKFISKGLFSKEVLEAGRQRCINQNPGPKSNS